MSVILEYDLWYRCGLLRVAHNSRLIFFRFVLGRSAVIVLHRCISARLRNRVIL